MKLRKRRVAQTSTPPKWWLESSLRGVHFRFHVKLQGCSWYNAMFKPSHALFISVYTQFVSRYAKRIQVLVLLKMTWFSVLYCLCFKKCCFGRLLYAAGWQPRGSWIVLPTESLRMSSRRLQPSETGSLAWGRPGSYCFEPSIFSGQPSNAAWGCGNVENLESLSFEDWVAKNFLYRYAPCMEYLPNIAYMEHLG